jgi:hypothetical protein
MPMHAVLHRQIAARAMPPRARLPLVVMKPWRYLKLRREAAGLSVDDVATQLAPKMRDRSAAADLVRQLEREGFVARHPETLERLRSAFAFDPDVYRQLATEPVSRHPRVCHRCACSESDACVPEPHLSHASACHWVSPHLCSRCDK